MRDRSKRLRLYTRWRQNEVGCCGRKDARGREIEGSLAFTFAGFVAALLRGGMFVAFFGMGMSDGQSQPAIVGCAATSTIGPTDDEAQEQQDQNGETHVHSWQADAARWVKDMPSAGVGSISAGGGKSVYKELQSEALTGELWRRQRPAKRSFDVFRSDSGSKK